MGKKRKARKIREGKGVAYVSNDWSTITSKPQYEEQDRSTHLMVDNIATAKKGEYKVWPSISPGPLGKYHSQSFEEAEANDEMFKFRNKKRAEKFAHGSWKKGEDKKEAMANYRESKGKNHPHVEKTDEGKNVTSWKYNKKRNRMVIKEKDVTYRTKDSKREVYKYKEVIKDGKTVETKKLKKGGKIIKKYKDEY